MRQFGMSKEGVIARQFMLGVVQTAEGLPIYHEVFDGNTAETQTLAADAARRCWRASRITPLMRGGRPGLAVAGQPRGSSASIKPAERRSRWSSSWRCRAGATATSPNCWRAFQAKALRRKQPRGHRRDALARACAWSWRTTRRAAREQTAPARRRASPRCSTQAAAAGPASSTRRMPASRRTRPQAVRQRRQGALLSTRCARPTWRNIIKVDLKSELFTYDIDEAALQRAELMDGKLLLVTNVPDLTPEQIVERYKALADIERGFRVLKSEIEIAPVFHRLPERIRAHAIDLLHGADPVPGDAPAPEAGQQRTCRPKRHWRKLRRIQRHRVTHQRTPRPSPACPPSTTSRPASWPH